jgi:glyoxylase-like metal-dependent hydrolase (beta-lactamase superfamily II)
MKNYVTQKNERGYDISWKIGDVEIIRIPETYDEGNFVGFLSEIHKQYDFSPEGLKTLEWMTPHYITENGLTYSFMGSFLIKYKGKNILIDTGGGYEGPYFETLKAAGCAPEDINYVMFTHLHSDHVAKNVKLGVWYEFMQPMFPNARYLFNKENYNFLAEMHDDPSKRLGFENHDQLWTYRVRAWPLVDQGMVDFIDETFTMDDIISLAPYPGHMTGEVGFWIKSKGDVMLICGDVIQHPYQLTQLRAVAKWEDNPELVYDTRKKLLSTLAGTDTYFIAYHWPNGGFVVEKDGNYQLVPSP